MMRSYFGAQEGDFELEIESIAAVRREPDEEDGRGNGRVGERKESGESEWDGKRKNSPVRARGHDSERQKGGWRTWVLTRCGL